LLQPLPDKLGHALLFFVQALLLHRALRPPRGSAGRALLAAMLFSVLLGGATELVQLGVPGRDGDLADLGADALGAALYGLLWWVRGASPGPVGEVAT
jgi:VanZ family protein